MAKRIHSVRLEERQEEVLRTRTKMLGVSQGEYIRSLIDADRRTAIKTQDGNLANVTINVRNSLLNEITLAVVEALTREFDDTRNKKPVKTLRNFARKYDFSFKAITQVLNQLVKSEVFVIEEKEPNKIKYEWTYLGVTAFPEYAPISTKEDSLVSGSACGALQGMLGEYDDIIASLASILKIEKNRADLLMRFFLQNYVGYFTWLREVSFPITGVCDSIELSYYRNQMLNYLLSLISNYGNEWRDWKTNEVLNLQEIAMKIMEHKIEEFKR